MPFALLMFFAFLLLLQSDLELVFFMSIINLKNNFLTIRDHIFDDLEVSHPHLVVVVVVVES